MPKSVNNKTNNGAFRPSGLLAPTLTTSIADYSAYLKVYQLYVDSLTGLKTSFWNNVKTKTKEVGTFEDVTTSTVVSKTGAFIASGLGQPQSLQSLAMVNERVLTEAPGLRVKKSVVQFKTAEKQEPQKKDPAKAKAKKQRWRENRRRRILAEAVKTAKSLEALGTSNVKIAVSAAKLDQDGWTVVTPRGKRVPAPKLKRSKKKKPSPKSGGGGPSNPPPPGGSGGSAPKGNKSPDRKEDSAPSKGKEPESDKREPNRKERRQAIYGLPPVEPVAPPEVVLVEKPAPFSFDGDSSSEDEKRKPAKVWPPPTKSWQVDSTEVDAALTVMGRAGVFGTADGSTTQWAQFDRPIGLEPQRIPPQLTDKQKEAVGTYVGKRRVENLKKAANK